MKQRSTSFKLLLPLAVSFGFAIGSEIIVADEIAGREGFKTHCASCHTPAGQHPRQAPPPFAIQRMTKMEFATKEAFTARIVDWVNNPTEEKALIKHAVEKLGVMPKQDVPEKTLREIADYLYDAKFEKPKHKMKDHKNH